MSKYRNCPECHSGAEYCYSEPHQCDCGYVFKKRAWDDVPNWENMSLNEWAHYAIKFFIEYKPILTHTIAKSEIESQVDWHPLKLKLNRWERFKDNYE